MFEECIIENYTLPEGRSLGLKVVWADGRPEHTSAPKGFRWNLELGGETEAPDWNPEPRVGGGLHVWEWARGYLTDLDIWNQPDVIWLAVEYETSEAVSEYGCVKVPKCKTIAIAQDKKSILTFIIRYAISRRPALFEGKTVDEGDVTVGDGGTAFVRGKGKATAGRYGTAIAGIGGEAMAWGGGTALVGNEGTATVEGDGRAEAGDGGTAIVLGKGIAWAGDYGTAQVKEGQAAAGVGGTLIFGKIKDLFDNTVRQGKTFKVGEGNIKPNTFYRLGDTGVPVPVESVIRLETLGAYTLPEGKSLGLKVVLPDGRPEHRRAPKGFRWNIYIGSETIAPDWDNSALPGGGGLHVWAWAQGDIRFSDIWSKTDVLWLAVEYNTDSAVELEDCVKVPECRVVARSEIKEEVVAFIQSHIPSHLYNVKPNMCLFARVEVEEGNATVGDWGYAITKGSGNAIAGYGGTARAGAQGFAAAGEGGTATAGDDGIAEVGVGGVAEAGARGILRFDTEFSGTKEFLVGQEGIEAYTSYTLTGDEEIVRC